MAARSATADVDAGSVARALGGGGHPTAASATLKDVTLVQAKERLMSALMENVAPGKKAEDIMSYPPIMVDADAPLKDVAALLQRYNINAAPALRAGRITGVITRQVADKAVYHGLGSSPAGDYATTNFDYVDYDTPVEKIREKVVGRGQRLLPVLKNKKVAGVITRTDLLKLLQEELASRPDGKGASRRRVIAGLMRERLPKWLFDILAEAGRVADETGVKAFIVGGFVRDLIMRREDLDVDIVIEGGDGIRFAEAFAKSRGLMVRPHTRFKTAVVIFPDGYKIDVATARLEYYEKPGALPTVEQSSLKLDLYRRDFIINTLAVAVNAQKFGEVTDFFGAERDIKDKTIRVLHNLSFIEDPTRILRAVRFSGKFGFKIEKHTLNLIKNAVKLDVFRRVSGPRTLEELKTILEEESAAKAINALDELGVLDLIHASIKWGTERELLFERTREALAWHRLLYTKDATEDWLALFLALSDALNQDEFLAFCKRLSITGRKNLVVINARQDGLKALARLATGLVTKNSALYELLNPLPLEVIAYLIAKAQKEFVKKALVVYVTKLKTASTELNGADLKKMGLQQGRLIGDALKALFDKKLDGEAPSRADEEDFIRRFLKRNSKTA
jgi:tRNA nucleotidyltransferase (CCA-adding enzyme)